MRIQKPTKQESIAWIEQALKIWESELDTPEPEHVLSRIAVLTQKQYEHFSRIDLESLKGWKRRWVEWNLQKAQETPDKPLTIDRPLEEDGPKWLQHVELHLAEAWSPTINYKALAQKRPTQPLSLTLGEWLGHEQSNWCSEGLKVAVEALPEGLRGVIEAAIESYRPRRLALVQKIMLLAHEQPLDELRRFIRGYSLGLAKGTIDEKGKLVGETKATLIYWILSVYADFVNPEKKNLKSIRELYEWLQMLLGVAYLEEINGFKRVEKICERIELKYGVPGRPRGE